MTRTPLSSSKGQRSRSLGRFAHRRIGASGGCSGGRENVLAMGNCCYVAVCSAAQGVSAPTEGGEGRGYIVAPARLQFFLFSLTGLFFQKPLQVRPDPRKISQRRTFRDCGCRISHRLNSIAVTQPTVSQYSTVQETREFRSCSVVSLASPFILITTEKIRTAENWEQRCKLFAPFFANIRNPVLSVSVFQ